MREKLRYLEISGERLNVPVYSNLRVAACLTLACISNSFHSD